ncbi:MAG: fibronectin type III domain-containing protein [Bacteroidales bacterium]|jgi:hypothetical protein|nr:fibronectin type III domain-containing protein [Bacteroidales bacterium]
MKKLLLLLILSIAMLSANAQSSRLYGPYYNVSMDTVTTFASVKITDGTRVGRNANIPAPVSTAASDGMISKLYHVIVGDTSVMAGITAETTIYPSIPIGFDFNLSGKTVRWFNIGANGMIFFGTDSVFSAGYAGSFFNSNYSYLDTMPFISAANGSNMYYTFGNYDNPDATRVSYKTDGGELIVQWENVLWTSASRTGAAGILDSNVSQGKILFDTVSMQIRVRSDGTFTTYFNVPKTANGVTSAQYLYIGFKSVNNNNRHYRTSPQYRLGQETSVTQLSSVLRFGPGSYAPLASNIAYTFSAPANCLVPTAPPTITLNRATSTVISGKVHRENADGSLVILSKDPNLVYAPTSKVYSPKTVINDSTWTVTMTNDSVFTTYNSSLVSDYSITLEPNTTYYVYAYSYNYKCMGDDTLFSATSSKEEVTTGGGAPEITATYRDTNEIRLSITANGASEAIVIRSNTALTSSNLASDELFITKNMLGDTITAGTNKAIIVYKGVTTGTYNDENLDKGEVYYYYGFSLSGAYNSTLYATSIQATRSGLSVPVTIDFKDVPGLSTYGTGQKAKGFVSIGSTSSAQFLLYLTDAVANIPTLRATATSTPSYFIMPDIKLGGASTYRLRFDAGFYASGWPSNSLYSLAASDSIIVEVTAAEDMFADAGYQKIGVITSENQNKDYKSSVSVEGTFAMYEMNIPSEYANQAINIRVTSKIIVPPMGAAPSLQYTNFIVEEKPACEKSYTPFPVSEDLITPNEIVVTWKDYEEDLTAWNISYKKAGTEEWIDSVRVTNDTFAIAGLDPQTKYNVRVQAVCTESAISLWSDVSAPIMTKYEAPFFCDFTSFTLTSPGASPVYEPYWYSFSSNNPFPTDGSSITDDVQYNNVYWTVREFMPDPSVYSLRASFGGYEYATMFLPVTKIDNSVPYKLGFDIYYQQTGDPGQNAELLLLISQDGGATFTINDTVLRWGKDGGIPWSEIANTTTHYEISLKEYTSPVQVAFYKGNTGNVGTSNSVYITNVSIELSCPAPTDLTVSSVGKETAELAWSSNSDVLVRYKAADAADYTYLAVTLPDTSLSLTGLTSGVTYECGVQGTCTTNDSSTWLTSSFTTYICNEATNLRTSNLSATGITIAWDREGATSFNVRYRKTSEAAWTVVTSATSPKALSGLTPGTNYTYSVQVQCSADLADTSLWATAKTFNTLPPCDVPTAVSHTNVTKNSFEILYTQTTAANIYVNLAGGAAEKNLVYNNSQTYVLVDELTANTPYVYKLRAFCSEGDTSAWTATGNVTTLQDVGISGEALSKSFNVYVANKTLYISNPNGSKINVVEIFNTNGQKVGSYTLNTNGDVTLPVQVKNSLIVVRLHTTTQSITYKAFVK